MNSCALTRAELERENEQLLGAVAANSRTIVRLQEELLALQRRDRSPRRLSAAASHARLEMTCSAMQKVILWERDAKLEEKDARIRELEAAVAKLEASTESQRREISGLRRGDGPVGKILLHNRSQRLGACRPLSARGAIYTRPAQ